MNEQKPETKRKSPPEAKGPLPEATIREGAVAASIWRRQSPSGYAYYDFSLSRSWKSMSSGRTGYSKTFFGKHKEELLKVIERVAEEIAKLEASDNECRPAEAHAA